MVPRNATEGNTDRLHVAKCQVVSKKQEKELQEGPWLHLSRAGRGNQTCISLVLMRHSS